MCDGLGASSTDQLRQLDNIWHVDFEFREDGNHLPVPVCMFAIEQRSGTEIFLERDQLLTLKRAPFGTGTRDVMVAYAANAELSCFLMLGWPFPCHVLDAYVETIGVSTSWMRPLRRPNRKSKRIRSSTKGCSSQTPNALQNLR